MLTVCMFLQTTMQWWFYEGVTDPTSLERLKQLHRVYKDKKKSKHLNVKRAVNALFVPRTFTLLHPTTFEVDMLEIWAKFCSSAPCASASKEKAKGEDQGKGKRKHQVEGPEAGFLSWGSKKARKAKKDTASHKGATKWKTFEGADSLLRTPAKQVL